MFGAQLHFLLHFPIYSLTLTVNFETLGGSITYTQKRSYLISIKLSEFSKTKHICVLSTQVKKLHVTSSSQRPSLCSLPGTTVSPKRVTSMLTVNHTVQFGLFYILLIQNQRVVSTCGVQLPSLNATLQFCPYGCLFSLPCDKCTTIYASILLLMDIWVASSLVLLRIMY